MNNSAIFLKEIQPGHYIASLQKKSGETLKMFVGPMGEIKKYFRKELKTIKVQFNDPNLIFCSIYNPIKKTEQVLVGEAG